MEDFPRSSAPVVPGYDVGRCLGRGGTAAVWLATERSTGREYALKCFTASDGPDGGSAEDSARREVRVLSLLDHAHLVRAYGVVPVAGGTGGNLALTMDYAAGGSLGQLVASRGTLGPGETVTVLTPIAQALAYLHAQGFTHGDVSPGNVLFTAQGKPLLADVGVARMVAETGAGAGAGTEGFSDPAPVDAVRAGLLPERDLYSLAAVGWFCLTGHPPEPGTQRPPLPLLVPGVPSALAAALESGLQEDRRLRPSAAELAAAFYHSAPAAPLDLSVSVHPTVIPQLPTRRALPGTGQGRRIGLLRALPRRLRGPRFSARRQGGEPQRTEPADPLSGAAPSARGRATGRRSSHRPLRRPLPVFAAHSARPAGALRAAAATVALLGALVAAWAVYGTWTPGSVPGLPVTDAVPARDAGAGKGSAPDAARLPPLRPGCLPKFWRSWRRRTPA
ncbi:serine/threonine-protein kinase [Pseudarthrobacter sp. So.54]